MKRIPSVSATVAAALLSVACESPQKAPADQAIKAADAALVGAAAPAAR